MNDSDPRGRRSVTLVVHAPNNVPHEFAADPHQRVDKLAREAVRHFVGAGQMQDLACGLVLVEDGVAVPLDDASRLEENGLRDHAVLKLVVKAPKTDGAGR